MKKKKLRVLATSDFHGDPRVAERLADKAYKKNVDLVVVCGDITEFNEGTEHMIGPFLKKGKQVFIIPGNHDTQATAHFLSKKYNVKNIDGYGTVFGDVGFFGCGGANVGINFMAEDEIAEYLERSFNKIKDKKKKVMVTHVHPTKTSMDKIFPGSDAVREAIKKFKPDIHLCGHMHESEGTEERIGKTRVINVGKHGKILDI